jgi:hypothetical protein
VVTAIEIRIADRNQIHHHPPLHMAVPSANTDQETRQQRFERVLSLEHFTGLKAVLNSLSPDLQALREAVDATKSYDELLAKLGYSHRVVRQIHVQDAFSRVGAAGGIKNVLPNYDIPTQRSLPTLVNFDYTVTSTPESAGFFNDLLIALKAQCDA